mmetsp:Transcript_10966/g.28984  ORF Transcript_10966/g.28984 Transcript_10966/m.28984 type:complete len:297 (-) Transcript_10966:94-984(-)
MASSMRDVLLVTCFAALTAAGSAPQHMRGRSHGQGLVSRPPIALPAVDAQNERAMQEEPRLPEVFQVSFMSLAGRFFLPESAATGVSSAGGNSSGGFVSVLLWVITVSLFAWFYRHHGGKAFVLGDIATETNASRPIVATKKRGFFASLFGKKEAETETNEFIEAEPTWNFSLFSCFDDPRLCIFSCCCFHVRWADTVDMAGLLGFSTALAIVLTLWSLSQFMMSFFSFLGLCVYTYYRQQLRARFGLPHGDCSTVFKDFCIYCWCCICAVTQEARQVEQAVADGKDFKSPGQATM